MKDRLNILLVIQNYKKNRLKNKLKNSPNQNLKLIMYEFNNPLFHIIR